jgi:Cu(I)/Ag(I) efflux system protein CusF
MNLAPAAALVLLLAAPAAAQPADDMKSMPGMAGAQGAEPSSTTATGVGVVTALDARAGTITIHHGPIAKLSWPAMTMAFKASSPTLLQGVKAGQSVTFTLVQETARRQ